MHLAIIVVIVVVTTIVFVAGFFLFDSDTHSGWLVPIIETCIFSAGIGPLIVYLYELLIDRHGDWQRIAQIRNMTMDRMRCCSVLSVVNRLGIDNIDNRLYLC